VCEKLSLVGDQIVEADTDAGDGRAVVIDHGETESDCEKKAREIVELECVLPTGCRQRGLDPVPGNQDGGEQSKQVLAHGIEEAEVLCQKTVDRLIHELQEIGLHWARLLRRSIGLANYGM